VVVPLYLMNLNAYCILMQPVVDAFDPRLLISPPTYHTLDFTTMKVKLCSRGCD
jgi:hypothetical protein